MTKLLIIDPQNDFMDDTVLASGGSYKGTLGVPGARGDMDRLAHFIHQNMTKIESIYVTQDWHERCDIAHPAWFKSMNGEELEPFSVVSSDQLLSNQVQVADPSTFNRTVQYLMDLEREGKEHRIWPYHCLKDTVGAEVDYVVQCALNEWELSTGRSVVYIKKGENQWTEHFSAIKACVVDPSDEKTNVNAALLNELKGSSIWVGGEALTHCVHQSVKDLVEYGEGLSISVLEDTMSAVPGFDATAVWEDFERWGVRKIKSEADPMFNPSRMTL